MLRRALPAILLLSAAIACGGDNGSPSRPSPAASTRPSEIPSTGPGEIPGLIGVYSLTFTASPSCSLPAYATKLTFAKAYVLEQTPGSIEVDLSTNYPCWGCSPHFTGTRLGDALSFVLVGGDPADGVVEVIGNEEISYDGTATGTFADKTITGIFNGRIGVVESSSRTTLASCTATDHKMEFVQ